eukprot:SAG31_NODE_3882_length_3789_cov_1.497561_2_plen_516_part_00
MLATASRFRNSSSKGCLIIGFAMLATASRFRPAETVSLFVLDAVADDVVAVCAANALADNGEAELLAIVGNTAPLQCAGAISVLNHFYGRDAVPIGAYNIHTRNATLIQQNPLPYVPDIVQRFDSPIKTSQDSAVQDAVSLYRKTLAAQPDRSVAISSIGVHTNLAALLKSGADEYSPLTGRELVAEKTFLLAVMGGGYPSGHECNLMGGGDQGFGLHNHYVASAASSYVAANWPAVSKIIWSGFGVGVKVQSGGAGFQRRCPVVAEPTRNPCAAAMINYENGPFKSRFSWDPLTTLVAVRGAAAGWTKECEHCNGVNAIDPNSGSNTWISKKEYMNQTYLKLLDGTKAGEVLDSLLCQKSKLNPDPAPTQMPRPHGMCVLAATAHAGAGPSMVGYGGGNYSAAWDGDVYTFYDYSEANGGWTEALVNQPSAIAHIEFYPRAGYLSRMVGGKFVGVKSDKSIVELGSGITSTPKLGWNKVNMLAEADVGEVVSVKSLGADGSYGNIAEVALYKKC